MTSRQTSKRIYQSVYFLANGLIYSAVLLRSILLYQSTPFLGQVLGLLILFLFLFVIISILPERPSRLMHLYLLVQTIITCLLIYGPDFKEYDYFALLFTILGMQVMQSFSDRVGILWIAVFLSLMAYPFIRIQGVLMGIINTLLFGSVIIFISAYSLATRRARDAYHHDQFLMAQLEQANLQLETYSDTLRQLGVAKERQRLRRELHDSVTQTIFSMTLTTQSALLLLDRDTARVGIQLERLTQLTQAALSEMHTLVTELRPDHTQSNGLVADLRQHLEGRQLSDGLTVSLEVEGEQRPSIGEEQRLFRIVQEALNNVIKHAHASNARLRMHMIKPLWIEIEDDGLGYDTQQPTAIGQLGLAGMRERAAEIGWELTVQSTPGAGTKVRVEKRYPVELRA